jgi:HD domain
MHPKFSIAANGSRLDPCVCGTEMTRRSVITGGLLLLVTAATRVHPQASALPTEVAGIAIPRTALTLRAESLARTACPDFLFNHCLRTYLFGALILAKHRASYDPQIAFVAAALHDLGLVPAFASKLGSFEIDGADRAEALMREAGSPSEEGRRVWNAITTHDMRREYAAHQSGEAELVNAGAAADVVGPDGIEPAALAEVVRVFPRLQFKSRFTAMLVDHCRRKPTSQIGWLDGLCRATVPDAPRGSVERAIAAAPYPE